MSDYYIGLISGTSVDGIDAVVVDYATSPPTLMASLCYEIPAAERQLIVQLCDEKISQGEINTMAALDRKLGELFADAALKVCAQANLNPAQITAIGHHGQTIRHYPQGNHGYTIQISDANTLAIATGIKVVADFRRKDIALGGEGAPMVPAFHQAVFSSQQNPRFIVNIGGIANITYLPNNKDQQILGFDTGPGNTLLDKWAAQHINQPFDHNGQWASTGRCIGPLLQSLMSHPYLSLPAPKSTGREDFNRSWLNSKLQHNQHNHEDVQATLVELTACTIAEQIKLTNSNRSVGNATNDSGEVYVCGGGASNSFLMSRLTAHLPHYKVATTSELGISPDWVEAMAFAWLAKAYIDNIAGNIPSVTGAKRKTILGAMYLP